MIAIILAGGQGTRLWPMSRKDKPKQFFDLLSDQPMIVDAYNRLLPNFDEQDIYLATLPEFQPLIQALLPQVEADHYIIEPAKRDSGPAMAYASYKLAQAGRGDEPAVFIPTDHYIATPEKFLACLAVGEQLVKDTGKFVDIGVHAHDPSTLLGYTQIGPLYEKKDGIDIFHFLGHTEKPDAQTAMQYLDAGNFLWHANYYMNTPSRFLEAFKSHAPEIYRLLDSEGDYERMPTICMDKAITEKLDPSHMLIIRGDFGWSDVGSWDTLYDRLKHQESEHGNVLKGNVHVSDTRNSLVYGHRGDKLIAAYGVEDLVIVDTDDVLFVCPRSKAAELKKMVESLKEAGHDKYL